MPAVHYTMQPIGRYEMREHRNSENCHGPYPKDDAPFSTMLYMLIPPSPLFAAHWSLFLPGMLSFNPKIQRHEESNVGTRIHVSGDRLKGFQLEIVRKYDFRKDRSASSSRRFPVGLISHEHLQQMDRSEDDKDAAGQRSHIKDEDEGGGFVDNTPVNAFEQVCVDIKAPGPSLRSISTDGDKSIVRSVKKLRSEVKDCQWWASQIVQALHHKGILNSLPLGTGDHESKTPIDIVSCLPKH